jgi:hypothetical protein
MPGNPDISEEQPRPEIPDNRIVEQYKIYVADLGNIGTRYTTSNGFYVSIISAFLILLALTDSGKNLEQLGVFGRIIILIFAGVLCYLWRNTIKFYHNLFRVKFDVIREIEEMFFPYSCYKREEYFRLQSPILKRLTNNEVQIPFFLGILFVILILATVSNYIGATAINAFISKLFR